MQASNCLKALKLSQFSQMDERNLSIVLLKNGLVIKTHNLYGDFPFGDSVLFRGVAGEPCNDDNMQIRNTLMTKQVNMSLSGRLSVQAL